MVRIATSLVVFFLLCSATLFAQTSGKISGKIKDSNQLPIEAAVVSLLLAADNSLVKTQFSDADGSFEFADLKQNNYKITIEYLGFKKYQSESIYLLKEAVVLPEIQLQNSEASTLNEVAIEKKKAFVERKIDRTVVNVDAMISNAGTDAMEVLEKSPGIIVEENGTIKIKGKSGVMVFIDDKPTYLSGADLEVYLKSLPASTLDQIEIMTNPPAQYDAAGSAGVINIKTKKSKSKGFNGSLTSRISQGKRMHVRNGLNLNYTDNKVRVFGNINRADQKFVNDLDIFRRYKNEDGSTKTLFDQNTIMEEKVETTNAKIGMDYYASEKTTFGINFTGLVKSGRETKDGKSILKNAFGALDSTIVADNRERNKFKNGGVNLNFRHDFDSLGRKITMDADFLRYENDIAQSFKNYIFQPDNSLSEQDELIGNLPSNINIYTFKTDYVHPFKKGGKLEAGYKISYSKTDNIADYANVIDAVSIPNYDSSNHFKYDETINALYLNYSREFKRFGIQTGLRLENTISEGNQLGNILKPASKFKRDYTNLFPTVYLSYKLDSIANNQLVLSYGKRINRPYFQDLNPFLSPLDKFTYYSGNPYLNPSFSHNLEFTYNYKTLFSTTLSYAKTKDEINETIEISDGIYYSRPGNIGKSQIWSLNINSDIPITDWLSANIYSEVTNTNYKSQLYTERLDVSGTFWFISALNRLKFANGWSAEFGGRYMTDMESAQFTAGARGAVNLAAQKKILSGKGSLKLAFNDIFYTNINTGTINNLRLTDANYRNKGDIRFIALTFTYGFGKSFESKKTHDETGSESEQNRVKN
ncbi:outer membrane beta-barrel protein [uncultured Flavobacterium sp.]|uniref:outer membrane beta-barrel protein n=1 Tax=uncultured Flavobacterium sp. TaxID=165435 RepID=UPI0025CE83C4|nr:outer membrane beta-barrel protein [uncultured Flavobacterium sp.]